MPPTVSSSTTSCSDGGQNKELAASIMVIASMGLTSLLIMRLPPFLAGCAATALAVFGYMWMKLHGMKLTRHETVYFDEKLLLAAKKDANYDLIPLESSSLFSNLIHNEEHREMQSFYAKHYGPVWETAERARILAEQRKELQEEDEIQTDAIDMLCAQLTSGAFAEDEALYSTASEISVE